MLKRCSKCGVEKDITDFYRSIAGKDGYQSRCKKCILEYNRAYKQTSKGKIAQTCAVTKYLQTRNGKTALACAQKKYVQTEKGKMGMKRVMHRRRARMKNTEATLTAEQWDAVIRLQGNICNICKRKFTKKRFPTMDHIIPLSKRGGLTFENVQALCGSCNSSKNAKLDKGFIQTWSHRQWKIRHKTI